MSLEGSILVLILIQNLNKIYSFLHPIMSVNDLFLTIMYTQFT
jgi:hypothetical protein